MRRHLLSLALASLALVASAPAAEKSSVLGKVQAEIRLTDGTVFKKAKIVDYSLDKATATIAEPTRIRVVALDQLPPALRDQLLAEAGVKPATAPKHPAHPRAHPARPPLQAGGIAYPAEPPVAATHRPPPAGDSLLNQAATAAPVQLKAHLTRTYGQVGSLTTKILDTGEVPGWPKIRVSGETSFTERTPGQRASSLHREKFEIEYVIADGLLKPTTVTVGGITRPITP
jgi:hypothetical protein